MIQRRAQTDAAIAAVRAALAVAAARTGADERTGKGGIDFATGADLAAEDAIRTVLQQSCPGIAIVGEERGGEPPADGRPYWLIDPICGTLNYASNLALYCTNLALVESGVVTIAVVGDGGNGAISFAERGHGAFRETSAREPQRLRARSSTALCVDLAGKPPSRHEADHFGRLVARLAAGGRHEPRLLGSSLAWAKLASGDVSGLLILGVITHALHSAAGCLLAEEAGARITDLQGRPWTLQSADFAAAASPQLHGELLAIAASCA